MTKSRNILPPRRFWSAEEVAQLRQDYPRTLTSEIAARMGVTVGQVFHKARRLGVPKDPAFVAETKGRLIAAAGQGSRYTKGNVPWATGTKGLTGTQPGSRATQFQPGQHTHTWLPVGSLRLHSNGYLMRKVADAGDRQADWKMVHRLVWEAAHGPIPHDHVVTFKPGRWTNEEPLITLDALECLPRAEATRRNLHTLPPELRQVIQLCGAVTRQINKRTKKDTTS